MNENAWSTILNTTPDVIVISRVRDGLIIYINHSFTKLFKYTPEEALGKTVHALNLWVNPTQRDRVAKAIQRDGKCTGFEIEYRAKDGKTVALSMSYSTIDIDGEPCFVSMGRDITDIKKSKQALAENLERLEMTLDANKAGSWSWDLQTNEIVWSDGNYRLLGYEPGEVEPSYERWFSRIHPDDRDFTQQQINTVIEAKSRMDFEYRVITGDGSIRWIHGIGSIVDKHDGSTVRMYGVQIDISLRKQAEAALRDSEQRMELALRGADLGTWDWNITTGAVTNNARSSEMLGYALDELKPHITSWETRVHHDDLPDAQALLDAHLHGKTDHFEAEYRIRHKSGAWIWVLDRGRVIERDTNGVALRACGTYLDITERKRSIEERQNREEQLKLVMSVTNDGWYDWDVSTNRIYFDPRYYTMAGYEPDEFPGTFEEWAKRVHPEEIAAMERAITAYLDGEIPKCDVEFRFKRKDGDWMWIRARMKLITRDESGTALRAVGTHTDINDKKLAELKLKEAQRIAHLGFWDFDLNAHSATWSEEMFRIFRLPSDGSPPGVDAFYKNHVPQSQWKIINEHIDALLGDATSLNSDYPIIRANGKSGYVRVHAEVTRDSFGRPLKLFGTVLDITDSKIAEESVRESEERFRGAFDQSVMPMALIGLDGRFFKVNEATCQMLQYSADEIIELGWERLVHPDDVPDARTRMMALRNREVAKYSAEVRYVDRSGRTLWIEPTLSTIHDEVGAPKYYLCLLRDVTETRRLSEELIYQATHDHLTDLVNRAEFERRVKRVTDSILDDHSEHALCYIDLDQFKVVNDTCGHVAGDEMLRQLSVVLQNKVRKRDTVARLGGDEFGVLIEHCSLDQAQRAVNSLQQAVHEFQFNWEDRIFRVGVSIGLVAITRETSDVTELLKQADAACYMAKELGRNRIHVYHPEDTELAQRHGEMQWVTRLQRALEEDRFCLYAQTIVPLDGRGNEHYELLVRMTDENGRSVPPGAFLPAAERYNLIEQLDRWVIKRAFTLLAENSAFLARIGFVSINLSGHSLTQSDFLDFILCALQTSGIAGEKICFEITETAAIAKLSIATKFISTLKAVGCKFALDDFGSGLSSFGYLKNLAVDYLKIDGMFVKDIVDDPIDRAIVKSINEIGQVMGMQTIAEFVENDEIKALLQEIGVNYAQGYGIGKPLPFDELLASNKLGWIADIDQIELNRTVDCRASIEHRPSSN